MSKKPEILIIAWAAPPIMGSHGLRVANFAKYLQKLNWDVNILTIKATPEFPLYDKSSLKYIKHSKKVFRVFPGFFNKIFYKKFNSNQNQKNESTLSSLSRKIRSKLGSLLIELNICRIFDWTPFAIIKGLQVIKKKNMVILSSGKSDPHFIAYFLKRFNKNLIWVADYGDPWVFEPTYKKEHGKFRFFIEHFLEKNLLKYVDLITVTTNETKQVYLNNYKFLKSKKIKVVPMGASSDYIKQIKPTLSNKFRIIYAGSIYQTRNVNPFLNALEKLFSQKEYQDEIEVLFVGNIQDNFQIDIKSRNISNNVKFLDFVPYEKSISLMKGSDIILSFGNTGGSQVPGKLFDCISLKKPVLWIKGDKNDPALEYIKNLNFVIITKNNELDIYKSILDLYEMHINKETGIIFDSSKKLDISWKSRINKLNTIIGDLIDK